MNTKALPIPGGRAAFPPAPAAWAPASRKAEGASSLDREALSVAAQFAHALENAPDDTDILLALGRCLEWLGDAATAGEVFRRILILHPANRVAAASLRRLQLHTGEALPADPMRKSAVPSEATASPP